MTELILCNRVVWNWGKIIREEKRLETGFGVNGKRQMFTFSLDFPTSLNLAQVLSYPAS